MPNAFRRCITWLLFPMFLNAFPLFGQGLTAQGPPPAGVQRSEGRETRIDEVLSAYDNTRSPGCAVGVVADGGLAFARGYGMANLDHGLAISPRTVFRTGSVSKQFTAAVVVLLAREGFFSIDDGIRMHFPELPQVYEPVTVRQLLHHTSGIRDYLELQDMRGVGDESTYSEDDVVRLLVRQKALNFPSGSEYLYSNSGYLLLSRLVHRTTGRTLRDQAQRLLFQPLGMQNTHFHDDHREIVPNRAAGYGSGPDGRFYLDQTTLDIVGDGGVFTNIEDLSLWMANFWGLEVGGREWLTQMETRGILTNGDTVDYGLGLRLGAQQGIPTVGHGGAFVGYRAATLRYPTEGVAVMALCNYARANPSEILEQVGAIWLGDRMPPEPEGPAEQEPSGLVPSTSTPISPADQAPFLGEYYSEELDATYRIFKEGEALRLDVNGAYDVPLERSGPGTLATEWYTLTYTLQGGAVTRFEVGSGRAGGVLFIRR